MEKISTIALMVLSCVSAAFGQSVRDEAVSLLSQTLQTGVYSPDTVPPSHHENVKFAFFGPEGEMRGQFIKDYQSPEHWREVYTLEDYVHTIVRNGQQVGEFKSSVFEPVRLDQLRNYLPPVSIQLEEGAVVKKISRKTVEKVEVKCIEYQVVQRRNELEQEACVNPSNWTLVGLKHRTKNGICAFGCGLTEAVWTDYTTFGGRFYPRHLVVKYGGVKIIEGSIEFTSGIDNSPDLLQIPDSFEVKKVCSQTTPPVRLSGQIPNNPKRLNQFQFEGTVVVQVRIGTDGRVMEAQVVRPRAYRPSSDPDSRDISTAILGSVRDWKFKPATCDGVPMVQNMLIPFRAEVR